MPIITVSRGTMSGGKALAERVAGALGSPCIAREVLVEGARKLGVSEQDLRERMERSPSLAEHPDTDCQTYILATQSALADHVASGDVVYHGLAGHLLLSDIPEVLRVRLIAPLGVRLRALMQERQMSRQDAERFISEVDQQRARWTRAMYFQDVADPRQYDVVLNLEKTSIESACAVVLGMARQPEFEITGAARSRLIDFAVACRVRLALAASPDTRTHELAVTVRDGKATLLCTSQPGESAAAARRRSSTLRLLVEGVVGVQEVIIDAGSAKTGGTAARPEGDPA
jgi:cytidylate kinase